MSSDAPAISVVLPTYQRLERLQRVLASLAAQDLADPFEVVVVSDGSTDGTEEYLSAGRTPLPVRAVCQANQGPAAARNAGIRVADGDLVVFIDDDVVADRALLARHLDAHRRHGPDTVVIGPMLNPPDHHFAPWTAWEQAMLAKQYEALHAGWYVPGARQFYTGNASIRREHLDAVGGFDESFRRAEDIELAFRLADRGLGFHFDEQAIGYHYAERSFDSWRATGRSYGRNEVVFGRDLGRADFLAKIADEHHRRPRSMRALIAVSMWHPAIHAAVTAPLAAAVRRSPDAPLTRTRRLALSVVYALEYHRGLLEEAGSHAAYRTLLHHGRLGP